LIAADPITRAGIAALIPDRAQFRLLPDSRRQESTLFVLVERALDTVPLSALTQYSDAGQVPVCVVLDELGDTGLLPRAAEAGLGALALRDECTPTLVAAMLRQAGEHAADATGAQGRLKTLLADQDRVHRIRPSRAPDLSDLDKREVLVLRLLADGLGTAEIASLIGYSESTIKGTVSAVLQRHQLRNRIHAITVALRQGLI